MHTFRSYLPDEPPEGWFCDDDGVWHGDGEPCHLCDDTGIIPTMDGRLTYCPLCMS